MWEKVWDTIKAHPYAFGGAILVVVLYLFFFSKSSSDASSQQAGIYAETEDPNLIAQQTATTVAQDQTNAQVSINATNSDDALQANQQNDQAATAIATINNSSALSALQSNNQTAVSIAGLQAGAYTTGLADSLQAAQLQYSAAEQINAQNTGAAVAIAQAGDTLNGYLASLALQGYQASGETGGASGGGLALSAGIGNTAAPAVQTTIPTLQSFVAHGGFTSASAPGIASGSYGTNGGAVAGASAGSSDGTGGNSSGGDD